MEDSIKKRKIKVNGMSCDGCEKTIEDIVSELPGVSQVNADSRNSRVSVEYNIMQTRLRDINHAIAKAGYSVPGSLRTKFTYFLERNEYNNRKYPITSCSSCCGCSLNQDHKTR